MALIRSIPQTPVPWQRLLLAVAALWLAPVLVGFVGLAMFGIVGKTWAEFGLGVWFVANALTFSPLFSWVGWGIALPPVWAALRFGWFGWVPALAIGSAAGGLATEIAQTEAALPFGIVALLILRAVLGRMIPL